MFFKNEKNDDLEFLGLELIKVEDYYLLSSTEKLLETVLEDWFKNLINDLKEVIADYYPDFQIYLAYIEIEKNPTILGYVYVRKEDNKANEECSDVGLNKAMRNICDKYDQMDTLFITLQRERKNFEKLKKGSVKEHFIQALEKSKR